MKRKILIKAAIFALLSAIILNTSIIFVSASSHGTFNVNKNRFLADEIYVSGASAYCDPNGYVNIENAGGTVLLKLTPDRDRVRQFDNALRIVVSKESTHDTLSVEYILKNNNDEVKTGSSRIGIDKDIGTYEYIVPLGEINTLDSLEITFEGGSGGSLTILSIATVSYYFDGRDFCGTLVKNEYDTGTKTAALTGTVDWTAVSQNGGARIVVYRLAQNESSKDVAVDTPYVASCDISLSYNLSFRLDDDMDYYDKYLVAVLTENGEVMPIAPEFYLYGNENITKKSESEAFKGIETEMYAGAVEAGSTAAFVDIDLDRLISKSESGFQYVFDGKEYYLNGEYIAELDEKMDAYANNGTEVYFRFLIKGYGDAKHSFINIYNKTDLPKVIGYIEYLIERYSDVARGALRGIILGRMVDKASTYNNCGQDVPSGREYAEKLAQTCAILSAVINRSGADVDIVIPFSYDAFTVTNTVDYYKEAGTYERELLAGAMLEYLDSYRVPMENITFMLEGFASPIEETSFDQSGTTGGSDRAIQNDGNKDDALAQCQEFEAMMKDLSERYEGISKEFIYCWYASDEKVSHNYIYNYNVAASFANIKLFVVSLLDSQEQSEVFAQMKNAYKYADTTMNPEVGSEALVALGKSDWSQIVGGYNEDSYAKISITRAALGRELPKAISGSYKMWDFASASNTLGWSARYGAEELRIYNSSGEFSHSLAVEMTRGQGHNFGADYGTIGYSPKNPLKLDGICGVSLDLYIPEADTERIYEILLRIEGADEVIEASGVVFAGNEVVLYADIESIDTVKSIKLCARDLNSTPDEDGSFSVYIKNISIHSDIYSDVELERIALEGGLVYNEDEDAREDKNLIWIAAVMLTSIAAVAATWIIYKTLKKN